MGGLRYSFSWGGSLPGPRRFNSVCVCVCLSVCASLIRRTGRGWRQTVFPRRSAWRSWGGRTFRFSNPNTRRCSNVRLKTNALFGNVVVLTEQALAELKCARRQPDTQIREATVVWINFSPKQLPTKQSSKSDFRKLFSLNILQATIPIEDRREPRRRNYRAVPYRHVTVS